MDINYRILWFEDTDESFDTLSRRTIRYVNKRNLRCTVDRVLGASDFDIAKQDLNVYDILVVDLRLSEDSKGFDIIKIIRQGNYVNDVLFYSAEGVESLSRIMKEHSLEGVFITDRDNKIFMRKIQQLVEKSIRRSENVINIRGVVMDETSEFDTQMCEIVNKALDLMTSDEIVALKSYICDELLPDRVRNATVMAEKYNMDTEWCVSDITYENDFNSMMKAKVLNHILNMRTNAKISEAANRCRDDLPQAYDNAKIKFVTAYDSEILKFRNKLAHVKMLNATPPVYIGKINGTDYYCNSEFCEKMRSSLIKYDKWFGAVYDNMIKD